MTEKEKRRLEEHELIKTLAQQLEITIDVRKLYEYSAYMQGVRAGLMHAVERFVKFKGEQGVYDKAEISLVTSSIRFCDWWLSGKYEMRFRNHVRDKKGKKGKLVSCEAYFAKRVVQEIEVK